jgi:hypothetical protein
VTSTEHIRTRLLACEIWDVSAVTPTEIASYLLRYCRLNVAFERTKKHLIAFVQITFISILSRRLQCLVTEELSA